MLKNLKQGPLRERRREKPKKREPPPKILPEGLGPKRLKQQRYVSNGKKELKSGVLLISRPSKGLGPKGLKQWRVLGLSIVVNTYNRKDILAKTLNALIPQLKKGDEIIVCDDGSDDGTREMVETRFKGVIYLAQTHRGYRLSRSRNMGIRCAHNFLIVMLNDDCVPDEGFLEAYRDRAGRGLLLLGGLRFQLEDGSYQKRNVARAPVLTGDLEGGYGGNICFHKWDAEAVGLFTEEYDGYWGYDDTDFLTKMRCNGVTLKPVDAAKATHQHHEIDTAFVKTGKKRNKALLETKYKEYRLKIFNGVHRHGESPQLKIPPSRFATNSFLIVVDVYNWAWDIASRELLKAMPHIPGKIVDINDLKNVTPSDYGVVLVYPWGAPKILDNLSTRNTVICVAGGEQLKLIDDFKAKCGKFKFYGACNEKIQRFLQERFPGKKVIHLTHGVDSKLFKPSKQRKRRDFTVGWVGKADRAIKRFYIADKVAKEGGFKMLVAGFKSRPHKKMPEFYNSVDCLLVTSITEAHPMIVYEAMACGLPVVTTDVGDVDRYIINDVNGFILRKNAPTSDYIKILNILKNDKVIRKRVGEAARKTVLDKLTWKKIVEQYTPLPDLVRKTR